MTTTHDAIGQSQVTCHGDAIPYYMDTLDSGLLHGDPTPTHGPVQTCSLGTPSPFPTIADGYG